VPRELLVGIVSRNECGAGNCVEDHGRVLFELFRVKDARPP
jgi:hypothetical protein